MNANIMNGHRISGDAQVYNIFQNTEDNYHGCDHGPMFGGWGEEEQWGHGGGCPFKWMKGLADKKKKGCTNGSNDRESVDRKAQGGRGKGDFHAGDRGEGPFFGTHSGFNF